MKTTTEIGKKELEYIARMGGSKNNQIYIIDRSNRFLSLGIATDARAPYKKHQDVNPLIQNVLDGLVKKGLIEYVDDEKDPFISYRLTSEGVNTLNDLVSTGALEKVPQGAIPPNGKFNYRINK
jgi:hypothetical protein